MRKIFALSMLVFFFTLTLATPVLAAPNISDNSSCVAHCATQMGGQHVANCAQMMENGISMCAKMTHAECMEMGHMA